MLPERIVLIGPSGSGKSTIAALLGQQVGYTVVDTDAAIVERTGMPISEFFERFGEPAFRVIESEVVASACARSRAVIATGGGVVLSEGNWALMRPRSAIIGLSAEPETLLNRVQAQTTTVGREAERPLLAGDSLSRLETILSSRSALYARADYTIATDALRIDEVAQMILVRAEEFAKRHLTPRLCLNTPSGRSDIYIASGVREEVGELARRRWPTARRVWIISDASVDAIWGQDVERSFTVQGLDIGRLVVAPGEQSKSLQEVTRLCEAMTDGGVTRRDIVVALGGGVVGDLAGFVASITLRGLPLIQIPTSLLAMVDSSVGGKTGVNLPAGKNLAGAFYQPGVVVIDPDFLESLPPAEYRSGMAEIIKHSVIQPSTPLGGTSLGDLLKTVSLAPIPPSVIDDVLALNVAIKMSVVQVDERESGLRMILNFGHTTGHAIEADGYRYRHGEAVAFGMVAAMQLSALLGRLPAERLAELERLIESAGLPVRFDGDIARVLERLARDKKNVDGSLHWILPKDGGGVEVVANVDGAIVDRAIRFTHQPSTAAVHPATVL